MNKRIESIKFNKNNKALRKKGGNIKKDTKSRKILKRISNYNIRCI